MTDVTSSQPSAPTAPKESRERWQSFQSLSCALSLELAVPQFTVEKLLALRPGAIVETYWSQASDIPLLVNGELLAWSEFEVVDDRYGVRLTELA
jgi:flagellar motor switch protein FliN